MVINEKLILKRVSDLEGRGNRKYYVHPPVGLYYCTNSTTSGFYMEHRDLNSGRACRPVILAESMSPRFSEKCRVIEEDARS